MMGHSQKGLLINLQKSLFFECVLGLNTGDTIANITDIALLSLK